LPEAEKEFRGGASGLVSNNAYYRIALARVLVDQGRLGESEGGIHASDSFGTGRHTMAHRVASVLVKSIKKWAEARAGSKAIAARPRKNRAGHIQLSIIPITESFRAESEFKLAGEFGS